MIELFTSDIMLNALADILIWSVVAVIIYFFCLTQRLKKDIIKNALEDTGKMKKLTKSMLTVINKGNADRNSVRKVFFRFKQKAKNTRSILQVFIYDNGEDADLNTVVSLLSSVIEESNEFARAFNTKSKENIISSLNKTTEDLSKIEMILSSVVKRKENEALAKI